MLRVGAVETTSGLPAARGPLSGAVIDAMRGVAVAVPQVRVGDALVDDDLHLGLYLCYELHYLGLAGIDDRMEWDPAVLAIRAQLELAFEQALLERISWPRVSPDDVADRLREIANATGMRLSQYLARDASLEQFREFVMHRSAYHLKEADPHTWAIPRLTGAPKAALVEIQADEYGGGIPTRVHARLFADMMERLGLDRTYGADLGVTPGSTLATVNLMTLFGLHRRWRGAIVGHLAAFELTSSRPNRLYGDGLRRLGYGPEVTRFFDEHVIADSVHDMIATYDLAGALAADHPDLAPSIVFGALSLDVVEGSFGGHLLSSWNDGESSLRPVAAGT